MIEEQQHSDIIQHEQKYMMRRDTNPNPDMSCVDAARCVAARVACYLDMSCVSLSLPTS